MAQHNYGADALHFRPQRWLSAAVAAAAAADSDFSTSVGADPAGPEPPFEDCVARSKVAEMDAGTAASWQQPASCSTAAPPEPIPFLTGPRDW